MGKLRLAVSVLLFLVVGFSVFGKEQHKLLLFITGNTYARLYLPDEGSSKQRKCLICAREEMVDAYRTHGFDVVAIEYGKILAGDEGDVSSCNIAQRRRRNKAYLHWLSKMQYDVILSDDEFTLGSKVTSLPANGLSYVVKKSGVKIGFIFLTRALAANISSYNSQIAKLGGVDFLVVGVGKDISPDLVKDFFRRHKEIDVMLVSSIDMVPGRKKVYTSQEKRLIICPPADGMEAAGIELETSNAKVSIKSAFWVSVLDVLKKIKVKVDKGMPDCFCDSDCGQWGICKNGKCETAYLQKSKFELLVVRPKQCVSCNEKDIYKWLSRIVPNLEEKIIYTNTDEAKKILSVVSIDMLPLYIVKGDLQHIAGFEEIEDLFVKTSLGWILKPQVTGISVYWNRPVYPRRIDVFLIGKLDKDTYKVLKRLKVLRKDLPAWKFYFHYLLKKDSNTGVWNSMAGQEDMGEVLRQLCVKKYAPSKFLDYILCRYESGYGSFDNCIVRLGIDASMVDECVGSPAELEFLLVSVSKLPQKLNVDVPGLILFENNQIFKPDATVLTSQNLKNWEQGEDKRKNAGNGG